MYLNSTHELIALITKLMSENSAWYSTAKRLSKIAQDREAHPGNEIDRFIPGTPKEFSNKESEKLGQPLRGRAFNLTLVQEIE